MFQLKARARLLGLAGIFAAAGVIAVVTQTSAGSRINAAAISDQQLDGLGLNLRPVPETLAAAPISSSAALVVASDRIETSATTQVQHVLAEVRPGVDRSVWLVTQSGGDIDLPLGPYGAQTKRKPQFSGVVVDDQTGDILMVFYGGTQ